MKPVRSLLRRSRQGSALVLSLIFIVMFSALAAAMAGMSGANVQLAENQRQTSQALAGAHSGMEVLRYYLQDISIPIGAPSDRLEAIAQQLEEKFAGVSNLSVSYNANTKTMTIPVVPLGGPGNTSFAVTVTYGTHPNGTADYDVLDIRISGYRDAMSRQVAVSYHFAEIGNPIFDYGIATRGPLKTQGNVDIETFNEKYWADVYIESLNSNLALEMTGRSSIAGKVTIANGTANVNIGGNSSVFGAKGGAAMEFIKFDPTELTFPVPNPSEFEKYLQTEFQPGDPTSDTTLTNIRIPADTNPSFSGNTTINGVMYIEQPNTVSFTGNATIHGVIIAAGNVDSPSSDNHLDFGGTVASTDVSTLSVQDFGTLTEQTGTFILAPGFSVCFRGNFSTLNGVIAASGVQFQGNAGGTINGSVINYSDDRMELAGNTDLVFNRTGVDKRPAGFEPATTLHFMPHTYREPM